MVAGKVRWREGVVVRMGVGDEGWVFTVPNSMNHGEEDVKLLIFVLESKSSINNLSSQLNGSIFNLSISKV